MSYIFLQTNEIAFASSDDLQEDIHEAEKLLEAAIKAESLGYDGQYQDHEGFKQSLQDHIDACHDQLTVRLGTVKFLQPSEVSALTAGRELDALLAESFFGWFQQLGSLCGSAGYKVYSRSLDVPNIPKYYGFWGMGEQRLGNQQPYYSTRMGDAWLLVEELNRRGLLVDLTRRKDYDRGTFPYECEIWNNSGEPDASAIADEAPLAICRAALLAFLPDEPSIPPAVRCFLDDVCDECDLPLFRTSEGQEICNCYAQRHDIEDLPASPPTEKEAATIQEGTSDE